MQTAAHADNELNKVKREMVKFRNQTLQPKDFPEAVTNTLSETSYFSVLFWISFSVAITTLTLLVCWYCGSRRRASQSRQNNLELGELPDTISEIARADQSTRQSLLQPHCCKPREANDVPPYSV
jgi:hypothetical protein